MNARVSVCGSNSKECCFESSIPPSDIVFVLAIPAGNDENASDCQPGGLAASHAASENEDVARRLWQHVFDALLRLVSKRNHQESDFIGQGRADESVVSQVSAVHMPLDTSKNANGEEMYRLATDQCLT